MPKKAIDYSNTVIYKLVSNDLDFKSYYVGHTTDFVRRKQSHKTKCNNENNKEYNTKKYKMIREHGGWDEWSMIEIQKYPCKDVFEAKKKERECFEKINSDLNTYYPQRSEQEYYKDNIEKIKEFYKDNREAILLEQKQYREEKKDKIKEKSKETYVCDCGRTLTVCNRTKHIKTKFHNDIILVKNKNK